MIQETEIKIPIQDPTDARDRIQRLGFHQSRARVFERNLAFDLPNNTLRQAHQLLRLRQAGDLATLTYKGVPQTGSKHKSREERETSVGNFEETQVILERLGYRVTLIYEKYRTEFAQPGTQGTVTIDETPIGNFLELEGEAEWIDETARQLDYPESDYVKSSYGKLYAEWCHKQGIELRHMRFT